MITRTTLDAFTREHVLATRTPLVEALQTLDPASPAADALRRAIDAVNDATHVPATEALRAPNRARGIAWCVTHARAEYVPETAR